MHYIWPSSINQNYNQLVDSESVAKLTMHKTNSNTTLTKLKIIKLFWKRNLSFKSFKIIFFYANSKYFIQNPLSQTIKPLEIKKKKIRLCQITPLKQSYTIWKLCVLHSNQSMHENINQWSFGWWIQCLSLF